MRTLVFVVASLFVGGPALADFAGCMQDDPHAFETDFHDLGGGYVSSRATLSQPTDGNVTTYLSVTNCDGPQQMLAMTSSLVDGFDARDAAHAQFDAIVAGSQAMTLGDIAAALNATGARAEVGNSMPSVRVVAAASPMLNCAVAGRNMG